MKGVIKVEVQYKDQSEQLQLVVAQANGPIARLFGRDWLMKLHLDWIQLCANHSYWNLQNKESIACNFVWWPKIDADLKAKVKQCNQCQLSRPSSPVVPILPQDYLEQIWLHIHLDYAGPMNGKMFLIVDDTHSKWMEVEIVNSVTSQSTIECLRMIFARFGLPEMMVTDDGTCLPVVSFKRLHNAITLDRYVLPLIIHLQMALQKGQCRLSS